MQSIPALFTWMNIIHIALSIFPSQYDVITTISDTEIGWINAFDCTESSQTSVTTYPFHDINDRNGLKNYFPSTISVQILPKGTTPADIDFNNPTDPHALMTRICSDPVINLNDNKEMAWPLGVATAEWAAKNWYGTSAARYHVQQDTTCTCGYRDAIDASFMMFHACCNHAGLHLTTGGRCELDFANVITPLAGLSIWLGFTKAKDCQCTQIGDCNNGYEAQEICHFLEGNPAWISGDPHTMTFAGIRHDLQSMPQNRWGSVTDFLSAQDQFFYIYPCSEYDNIDMPYNMLVTHQHATDTISGADYIVLELFESDGNIVPDYYVYLGPEIAAYASAKAGATTYYDQNGYTKKQLFSGENAIGQSNRFSLSLQYNTESSNPSITAVLNVMDRDSGNCTLEMTLVAQGRYNHNLQRHQMNYIRVNPPECYKCEICGLFGDFKSNRMQTCTGSYVEYGSWLNAWDAQGWTWERSFVDQNCRIKRQRNEKPQSPPEYTPIAPPPEIITEDPCDEAIKTDVIQACDVAISEDVRIQQCCDNIGGDFCDNLQKECELDACVGAEGDFSNINHQVHNLLIAPIEEECSKLVFKPELYQPKQCPPLKQEFITPTCDGIQSNSVFADDPRGQNQLSGNGKRQAWKMVQFVNNPLQTWPLKVKFDGSLYGFGGRSECAMLNVSLNLKCVTKKSGKNGGPQSNEILDSHVCEEYYNIDTELYQECLSNKRKNNAGNGGTDIRHSCQLLFAFDVGNNKYIILNASSDGVSIYPPCGGELAKGNPSALIDGFTDMSDISSVLAGGDSNNWATNNWIHLPVSDTIQFDFHNNVDDNEFTLSFAEGTQQCVYSDSVQSYEDVKVYFTPDFNHNQMVLVKGFAVNGAERVNGQKGQTPTQYFEDFEFELFAKQELSKFAAEMDISDENESFDSEIYEEQRRERDFYQRAIFDGKNVMSDNNESGLIGFVLWIGTVVLIVAVCCMASKCCDTNKGDAYQRIPNHSFIHY